MLDFFLGIGQGKFKSWGSWAKSANNSVGKLKNSFQKNLT